MKGQLPNIEPLEARIAPAGVTLLDPARVAHVDLTGDGVADLITASAKGKAVVQAFDGITHQLLSGPLSNLSPFAAKNVRGAYLAVGDINGDGSPDLVVGAGAGGGEVKIYSGADGALIKTATPFGERYKGGVRVALGDVNGDGWQDVIVGAGAGGSKIQVLDGETGDMLLSFKAGKSGKGVFVDSRDADGDGLADIIARHGAPKKLLTEAFSGLDGHKIVRSAHPNSPAPTGLIVTGDQHGPQGNIVTGSPGDISAGSSGVLIKTGAGTLTLTPVNRFTGTTTLNGGTLSLGTSPPTTPNGIHFDEAVVNPPANEPVSQGGTPFDASGYVGSSLEIYSGFSLGAAVLSLGGSSGGTLTNSGMLSLGNLSFNPFPSLGSTITFTAGSEIPLPLLGPGLSWHSNDNGSYTVITTPPVETATSAAPQADPVSEPPTSA